MPEPFPVVTITSAGPAKPAGVVAVQLVVLAHKTLVAKAPPKVKVVPPVVLKLEPAIMTFVPPKVEPLFGVMPVMAGRSGVIG